MLYTVAALLAPAWTAAQVEHLDAGALFAEAVPLWMNTRYRIGDLRRAYLERKLTDVK